MKPLEIRPGSTPASMALRLGAVYTTVGLLWVLISDAVLSVVDLSPTLERQIAEALGVVLVLASASVMVVMSRAGLTKVMQAQDQVHEQETRIRAAYVDVLDAVTGGRLVLVTIDEMNGLLGASIADPAPIDMASRLSDTRARIRRLAEGIVPSAWVGKVVSASGEALNNALKHAGSGEYELLVRGGFLQVRVSDSGPGIDFRTLPKAALVPGFSTTNTLGMGFTIMLQLAQRVLICTQPGTTTVVLEFARSEADLESLSAA